MDVGDVQDLISKEVTAIFKKRTGVEDARFEVRRTTNPLIYLIRCYLGCLESQKSTCERRTN